MYIYLLFNITYILHDICLILHIFYIIYFLWLPWLIVFSSFSFFLFLLIRKKIQNGVLIYSNASIPYAHALSPLFKNEVNNSAFIMEIYLILYLNTGMVRKC